MKWPRWSSFKKNWLSDAASRAAQEAESEAAKQQSQSPSKSQEPTCDSSPATYVIPQEHEVVRPTRAQVLEGRLGPRSGLF